MTRISVAILIVFVALVQGCSTTAAQPQQSAGGSFKVPVSDDIPFAESRKETRTFTAFTCTTDACKVTIAAEVKPSGRCKVDAPDITLKVPDTTIIWELPPGYMFCPGMGDGVFLKDSKDVDDDQFDAMQVAANPSHKGCHSKFRWFALNSTNATKAYDYEIRFRNRGEKAVCIADPWVKNGR